MNCFNENLNAYRVQTDKGFYIYGVSYIGNPKPNTAMYVAKKVEKLINALEFVDDCLVFAEKGIEPSKKILDKHCFIFCDNPQLEYAKFADKFMQEELKREQSTKYDFFNASSIATTVKIGKNVYIEQGCFIGADVIIGDNVKILAGSIIKHAIIGNNSIIRENTVIGNSAYTIVNDDNGNSMRMPDLGRVIIGDNVEIGALTGVERGSAGDTIIEDYVKIDMHVVIGHDSVIHKNCHIIAGAVIAGFVTVGENSFVGLNAAIKNRTNIGENVIIGMGATVLKDASNNTTIVGNPGRELVKKK